ncbi:SDR family NAD(P)-dependent oxidoreductase [Actinomadura rayongensis]|uniref:SDR family NAD(P)-dependent oxidoreductase n=1 Tax=Actinomadura rayongensis TaxID=1429076 RepID=A0A6I4WCV1_9ACTN|nr:SDR family oxidoreductase [Actinomadura rayongensis]MXQ66610.1 SDR family NAD(P)-dependent oxidoreductase [Actinomadura rayongensis]
MSIAIVTGGASGIGRAIATSLVHRGDTVVVADINAEGARKVADKLNTLGRGKASSAPLDVTDAAAVAELYHAVRDEHGHLDLVFNNAGISIGGLAEELTLDHWNRAIDINLKGVVHGVDAAYRIMLEQGSGHIVNTASLAGLVPMPIGIPYTATKHAVVGLSLGLRAEAAGRGVKVSVVCPSFVDTPLLTNVNPGLPETAMSGNATEDIKKAVPRLYTAEKLARDIIRGVDRNKALIVAPAHGRAAWRGVRLNPAGAVRVAQFAVDKVLSGKK